MRFVVRINTHLAGQRQARRGRLDRRDINLERGRHAARLLERVKLRVVRQHDHLRQNGTNWSQISWESVENQ